MVEGCWVAGWSLPAVFLTCAALLQCAPSPVAVKRCEHQQSALQPGQYLPNKMLRYDTQLAAFHGMVFWGKRRC